jgi:hypothetical protein
MQHPRRWLALQKRAILQVSEDLPQQVHNGPLLESGAPLRRQIQRHLVLFPPHDDLPLLRDAQSPKIMHRSKSMLPHHADLLLLKDAPSKEIVHQSMLMFPLYAGPLQESVVLVVLLLEILLRKRM